jgi:hypothetical protein
LLLSFDETYQIFEREQIVPDVNHGAKIENFVRYHYKNPQPNHVRRYLVEITESQHEVDVERTAVWYFFTRIAREEQEELRGGEELFCSSVACRYFMLLILAQTGDGETRLFLRDKRSHEDYREVWPVTHRPKPSENTCQKKKIHNMEKETVRIRGQSITSRVQRFVVGDLLVFDFKNRKEVSAFHVSEGTLLVHGILALIYSPNRPEVILLDDIDKGLHPMAQTEMVLILRQLLSIIPDIQIVATTHSQYWLDSLTFAEVRLMTLDENGDSIIGKLEDHPEFDSWKSEMAPGE